MHFTGKIGQLSDISNYGYVKRDIYNLGLNSVSVYDKGGFEGFRWHRGNI